jgi:hypothetical protein
MFGTIVLTTLTLLRLVLPLGLMLLLGTWLNRPPRARLIG